MSARSRRRTNEVDISRTFSSCDLSMLSRPREWARRALPSQRLAVHTSIQPASTKVRGDLAHEAGHFVLDLSMRFQADVEVEDDFGETRRLDLLQGLGHARGRTDQNRIFGQVLRPHFLQTLDHVDEVAIAR